MNKYNNKQATTWARSIFEKNIINTHITGSVTHNSSENDLEQSDTHTNKNEHFKSTVVIATMVLTSIML
jgi:hypothetical protein